MLPTILAVDAHDDSRIVYSLVFRQKGFELLDARTSKEALDIMASCRPRAIVMELTLPDLDGCELIRMLKLDPVRAPVPILVVTSDIRLRRREEAEAAGCDAFLLKPSPMRVIVEVVRDLIDPDSLRNSAS
ncbi:MAG: response regulator [Gemmatimonadetes bacterium]|nr:response regulator [Gemmatimonadota bacterium]